MSDLIPNEGSFFIPEKDEAEQLELNKEKTEALQALPLLQDIISWFDKQADETNRMTNINHESKMPIESQILAYQLLADLFMTKKGELQAIFDTYKPKKQQ